VLIDNNQIRFVYLNPRVVMAQLYRLSLVDECTVAESQYSGGKYQDSVHSAFSVVFCCLRRCGVNRLTGCWECEILLAVGKDANVIIRQVSPLVNSEFAILCVFKKNLLWVIIQQVCVHCYYPQPTRPVSLPEQNDLFVLSTGLTNS